MYCMEIEKDTRYESYIVYPTLHQLELIMVDFEMSRLDIVTDAKTLRQGIFDK